MRPYKYYGWEELLKIRDALQALCDNTFIGSVEWGIFDNELAGVSEEIDIRYKEREKK